MKRNLPNHLASLFWKGRWFFLVCLGIVVAVCAVFAPRVRPDNSIEAITLENDPTMELLKRVEKQFGSEEFISVSFEADDVFSAKSLQIIEGLSKKFDAIDGVARIISLTTLWRFENAAGENTLEIQDFIDRAWLLTGVPKVEATKLLKHPLYRNMIYSPDGKAASIFIQLVPIGNDDAKRSEILAAIRAFTKEAEKKSGVKMHVWGEPVIHRDSFSVVEAEQNILPIFMVGAIFLLMYFSYRSLFIALSPLVLLGLVFVIVIGTLGILGINFNWLTSVVPAVIMIVCLCDTMHVINEYLKSKERDEKLFKSIYSSVGVPSLVASLTTAIGFLSLLTVPIKPVRQFGWYVAFGVVLAYIFTFTVFILFLRIGPKKFQISSEKKSNASIGRCLDFCLKLSLRYPKQILIVTSLIVVASIFGALQIKVNSKMLNIFKEDVFHARESNDFLKKGAGGGAECYMLLESSIAGRFYDPVMLRKMEEMQSRIAAKIDLVVKTISIADFVKYMNMQLHGGDPKFHRIPDTQDEVAQIFLLLEMEKDRTQWDTFVNPDYSKVKLRAFTQVAEDSSQTDWAASVTDRDMKEIFGGDKDIKAAFTGRPFATANMMGFLSQAMINSTLIASLTIAIVLMFLYRSVKVGLIASIPNLITILIGMGIMGFFNIQIDVATCMVFSIATGIADDDMVHMVWHMRSAVERGLSYPDALAETYDTVGIPIITSTIVLVGGFLMMMVSQVWPTTLLGIMVAICCVISLFATILVSASMILLLKPFKSKAH